MMISWSFQKGTILQRIYRKKTMNYNSSVKLHGKKIWEPQHDRVISISLQCLVSIEMDHVINES